MTETQYALILAGLLTAAAGITSPIRAQPQGATMLMPGVYTTPDISARCQRYARKRVGSGGRTDNERQAVFIACVRKLYRDKYGRVKPM
jgi:hypothetical protein